jgi:predicted RNA-binding Zn-ribbon protein involved in translation (DUF1610 family)
MVSTIAVEIVRVDKDTLKLLKYPLHVWPGTHEAMLKQVERGCAVGDFAIVRDGMYRWIRGGFRKATDNDMGARRREAGYRVTFGGLNTSDVDKTCPNCGKEKLVRHNKAGRGQYNNYPNLLVCQSCWLDECSIEIGEWGLISSGVWSLLVCLEANGLGGIHLGTGQHVRDLDEHTLT